MVRELCLAKDKRLRPRPTGGQAAAGICGASGATCTGGQACHQEAIHRQEMRKMPRWSAAEVERLRELYPTLENLEVARQLGRTVTSVANKAHQLDLKKSTVLLAQIGRANVSLRYRGASTLANPVLANPVLANPVLANPARGGASEAAALPAPMAEA